MVLALGGPGWVPPVGPRAVGPLGDPIDPNFQVQSFWCFRWRFAPWHMFFFLLSVTWINWNVFQYFSWFSLNLSNIIEYSCIKLLFFYLSLHFIDVFVYFIISQYAGSSHYHLVRFGCWKSFTDASWQAGLKDSSHFAVSASQPLKDSRKLPLV